MSVMSFVHFPGVCVQVSLQIHTQAVKIKRSCVVKGESDPHFSYRMTFKLRPQHLDEACLRFELQQPQDVRSGERFILKWIKLSVCLTQAHIAGHFFIPQSLQSYWECWCWVPSCTPEARSCSTGWTWSTRHRSRSNCGTDSAGPLNTPIMMYIHTKFEIITITIPSMTF